MNNNHPFVEAALQYAAMGWKVIPVNGKAPFFKGWPEKASDDPITINNWWSEHPKSNLGVVTGKRSGIFVLDVDYKYGGIEALEALVNEYGALPKTLVAETPGGGFHYIFKYPQGGIGNDTGDLPLGLDVRGDGGQFVVHPSVHESGNTYEWQDFVEPHEVEIAEAPEWLLNIIRGKNGTGQKIKWVAGEDTPIPEGQRDCTLFSMARSCFMQGFDIDETFRAVLFENQNRCKPPLEEKDIRRIVDSADKYEKPGDGEETEWSDPQPIKTELLSVEQLPFEILPEAFRPWIQDVSHRMQCPPDFVAMAAITLAGSLIGTRCGIRPKQHDDWLVIPNLWGGVVGRPSMLKTPSLNEALKPLSPLEKEAKESFDENIKGYEADLVEYQVIKKSLIKKMEKAADGKGGRPMEDIKEELGQSEKPERPTMERYKTNDATIEKLSELLNENPAGLLLFRDELVGLMASWEKPGRESDRAFFLEAWNGDGSHTTDRIGRGTIFTENLCISVFGGIQPSKLISYLIQSMNGLENDGLIQRLQLLVYPDEIKHWRLVDKAPNREARERAYQIIERLARMVDFTEYGVVKEEPARFPYLHFSEGAQQVFNDWLTDLELNKLRADDHPIVLEHFGKYRSLMPSLALIFHLIGIADGAAGGPISVEAAEKAAAFCEYLESHARRIYGLVTDASQQAGEILAEKIKKGKLKDGFTVRDIYRQNWHRLGNKELAQAACDILIDAGWLRPERTKGQGAGRPALPTYKINPKVKINRESQESNTDKTD